MLIAFSVQSHKINLYVIEMLDGDPSKLSLTIPKGEWERHLTNCDEVEGGEGAPYRKDQTIYELKLGL